MLLHETVGNVKKVASEGTRNLCHVQKPVVAARPGKDFPWCAVPNLGSTRSQRHETIAGSGRSGLSNGTTWNSGGETCDICASRGSHLKKLRSPMKI
ncbi:L-amino-acid oxidase [Trichinella spiralis]|uniref:L-amino-acid oxidase n=1 Tax=Trichinella spiralis TaxID=6334 RepID=A0ABR3L319_TRISP